MGNKKKKAQEIKPLTAEFKISMHCNACERTVAKVISKIKGVEKFMTDMKKHKIIVTGKFDPQKVMKKLRKKTGKAAEIVADKGQTTKDTPNTKELGQSDLNLSDQSMFECCREGARVLILFSDENPNACCIM